jgi:hypothetical protein
MGIFAPKIDGLENRENYMKLKFVNFICYFYNNQTRKVERCMTSSTHGKTK